MAYSDHLAPSRILICDDDGAYYLRQLDARDGAGFEGLVWFGQKLEAEPAWANVFAGRLRRAVRVDAAGNPVDQWEGAFFDVPKGRACGQGQLTLETFVNPPNTRLAWCEFPEHYILKTSGGGFGGRVWNMLSTTTGCWDEGPGLPTRPPLPPIYAAALRRDTRSTEALVADLGSSSVPAGFAQTGNLTGTWVGDDGGSYYIRHIPETGDVVWYGESAHAAPEVRSSDGRVQAARGFANVFVGHASGVRVSGFWADVPRGATRGAGRMTLRQAAPNFLEIEAVSGGFGGRRLWRVETLGVTVTVPRLTIEQTNEGDGDEPLLYLSFLKVDGDTVDLDALETSRVTMVHPPSTLVGENVSGVQSVNPANSTYRTALRTVRSRAGTAADTSTMIGVVGFAIEVDEGYSNDFRRQRLLGWRSSQENKANSELARGVIPRIEELRASAQRIQVQYLGPWDGWPWGDSDDAMSGDAVLVSFADLRAALATSGGVLARSLTFRGAGAVYRADVEFVVRSRLNPLCGG